MGRGGAARRRAAALPLPCAAWLEVRVIQRAAAPLPWTSERPGPDATSAAAHARDATRHARPDRILTQHRTARATARDAVADDETSKYERTVG